MYLNLISYIGILFILFFLGGCTSMAYKVGFAECAPVYGNWCGENYPLPGYDPPTVDEWDSACRDHDKCYGSSEEKRKCDRKLVKELERLSYEQLAPLRMHNAYSWFRRDGYVGGWVQFTDEIWGASADCKGGDGREAKFYCALNPYFSCPLDSSDGPGHAGMFCPCNGYTGIIVEK